MSVYSSFRGRLRPVPFDRVLQPLVAFLIPMTFFCPEVGGDE